MAKEKYIAPEMEIIEFEHEDVIITSLGDTTPYVPKSGITYDPNTRWWSDGEENDNG